MLGRCLGITTNRKENRQVKFHGEFCVFRKQKFKREKITLAPLEALLSDSLPVPLTGKMNETVYGYNGCLNSCNSFLMLPVEQPLLIS